MLKQTVVAAIAVFSTCLLPARGAVEMFGDTSVDIEYWTGGGSNSTVCVVDFAPGSSYAFGYRWDGAATGFEMLQALAGAGALEIEYNTDFGAPFVDVIRYGTHAMGAYWGWPANWLGYFVGTNGLEWADSPAGATDRALLNGDWDAWSHQMTDAWPPAYRPTSPPQYTSVLRGREMLLQSSARDTGTWQDVPEKPFKNLCAVVHNRAPEPDGSIRVSGIDTVVYWRRNGTKYLERHLFTGCDLCTVGGPDLRGAIDESAAPDVVVGVLAGRGPATGIRDLNATLQVLERTDGRLSAVSQRLWMLGRNKKYASVDEILDNLTGPRRGYPDPR